MRKLTIKPAWEYLNTTLLKQVDEAALSLNNIYLPISSITTHTWMMKCKSGQCNTKTIYCNDQHQKPEVNKDQEQYIETLEQLQRKMCVWVVLSKDEEDNYLECKRKSPLPTAMPLVKEVMIDNIPKYVHHIDDQGGWKNYPVLHPLFKPEPKPQEKEWKCGIGHSYDKCLCHLELWEHSKMNRFIAAVTTQALDGGLMVNPTQSVSLREYPKWFLDSKTTANKGWELQCL